MVYKFAPHASINKTLKGADPQKIGQTVEQIQRKRGGNFEAVDLVNEARSPKSALHRVFEWDNTEAAEQYRIQQARHLLSVLVVETELPDRENVTHRVFVSVTEQGETGYSSLTHVMTDESLRRQFLTKLLNQLETLQEQCKQYQDLAEIMSPVKEKVQQELKNGPQAPQPVPGSV
jgi:hypothetical protein